MATSRSSEQTYTLRRLVGMPGRELDALFRASPAGPIPSGDTNGRAITGMGWPLAGIASFLINLFVWKGKVFDPSAGTLLNKLGPLGKPDIEATVYAGDSFVDGNECIVLDYSGNPRAAAIRDEIRMVSPGVYLGIVFNNGKRSGYFALEAGHA